MWFNNSYPISFQKHEAEVARREKIYQHVDSLMKADEDNEEEKIRRVLAEEEDK